MGEQTFMMKSEVVGWLLAANDDLVPSADHKICEIQRFIIPKLSYEFPQISLTLPYEIIIIGLGYHKFSHNMGSKNGHEHT
jgi:hypothetical protein